MTGESCQPESMAEAHYAFQDFDGNPLGTIESEAFPVCPRPGETVTISGDGRQEIGPFLLHNILHTFHQNLDGDWVQIIDVIVEPPQTFPK
jgi:hypothetical protein